MKELIKELNEYRKKIESAGGEDRQEKQRSKGKMTARERLIYLFDKGSFNEVGGLVRDKNLIKESKDIPFTEGVITGYGKVEGELVFAYAQDFTILGGALGKAQAEKILKIQKMALENRAPIVGLNDSAGAKVHEGVDALSGYGKVLHQTVVSSGKIPQISAIMGPCAGGAVYGPSITDFVFMVEGTGKMFLTGPDVVKDVIGEDIRAEDLGGSFIHSSQSGVVHFSVKDDRECLQKIRTLLNYINIQLLEDENVKLENDTERFARIEEIFPTKRDQVYDMHKIIEGIVDKGLFFEVSENFAKNILVGFSRINGRTIGVVANQPNYKAGALDVDASVKAARFIRTCNNFGIGILNLVDLPGYLPGKVQEKNAIIRHGAKLLYAICEASVPKITLIIGKSYGGGYISMGSKETGADLVYAWPSAEIGVMGAKSASKILGTEEDLDEFKKKFTSPYLVAEKSYIDEIIQPSETRDKISNGFTMLEKKTRTFNNLGNIPL